MCLRMVRARRVSRPPRTRGSKKKLNTKLVKLKQIKNSVKLQGSAPQAIVNRTKVPTNKPWVIKVGRKFLKLTTSRSWRMLWWSISAVRLVFNFSLNFTSALSVVKLKIKKHMVASTATSGDNSTKPSIKSRIKLITATAATTKKLKALVHFIQNNTKIHMVTRANTMAARANFITKNVWELINWDWMIRTLYMLISVLVSLFKSAFEKVLAR